ncbi:hypothetical protein QLQ86_17540 [Halomonas sp. LR5S13]|nr:hypothetical protein [Halomonas rhizosphaerae]
MLVGPARRTEEGEGGEDLRTENEEQDHHADMAAAGDIALQAGAFLVARPQADPQHRGEVGQRDADHDH